jgi:hypothetical protein
MKEAQTNQEIEEAFEKYTLTPFGCSECGSDSCTVTPMMPPIVEDNEPALLVECAECREFIACVPITTIGYEMLLRGELEFVEGEKKGKND